MLPGIIDIRADSELVFLAISSDKLIILETLTPGAGSNSFKVTTGPWLTFFIFPSTPKSSNIFSKKALSIFPLSCFCLSFSFGKFNISIFGSLNFLISLFKLDFSLKGKSSCMSLFLTSLLVPIMLSCSITGLSLLLVSLFFFVINIFIIFNINLILNFDDNRKNAKLNNIRE